MKRKVIRKITIEIEAETEDRMHDSLDLAVELIKEGYICGDDKSLDAEYKFGVYDSGTLVFIPIEPDA